jgi:hypothetical protein
MYSASSLYLEKCYKKNDLQEREESYVATFNTFIIFISAILACNLRNKFENF